MNPRYSLKVIKQGQTHKLQTVSPGAGMQGQAMVVQAIDGARMQLADIVTLSAPEKLQMKRVGKDLQIALPGGDVDAPDIVVKDYYAVKDVSLQGQAISGEWQVYNTVSLPDTAPQTATPESKAAQGQNWSSGFSDPIGAQSVGLADASAVSAAQAAATAAATGTAATGMSMGTMIAVGAGGLALAGGGGGGGGGSAAPATNPGSTGLDVLKAYASATNGAGVTAPTLTNYSEAGIKTFKSLADTLDANRKSLSDSSTVGGAEDNTFLTALILNTALDKLDGSTLDKAKVQAMVDAYYRVLKEADGDSAVDKDVYADTTNDATNAGYFNDPRLEDYAAIGVTVGDAISTTTYNTTTGKDNETLDLLNDAVGRLSVTAVDTAGEVQTLATTANDVMLLAKVDTLVAGANIQAVIDANIASAASQTDANLIAGLNALLGLNTTTGLNADNLVAFKKAVAATSDVGLRVRTRATRTRSSTRWHRASSMATASRSRAWRWVRASKTTQAMR